MEFMIAGSFGCYLAKTARDHESTTGGSIRDGRGGTVRVAPGSAGLSWYWRGLWDILAGGSLPPRATSYCMDAALMSFEQHERGIHAV